MQLLHAAARAENRAAGQRLAVIGELDLLWLRHFGERETWGTDTHDAITDEIAAALGITRGMADSYLDYARAMRLRLPRVGALLVAGDIDYRTFQTIVYRTDLITDPAGAGRRGRRVGTQGRPVAWASPRVGWADMSTASWPAPIRMQCDGAASAAASGKCRSGATPTGSPRYSGGCITTDAHAVDARLDALAATVCDDDPRTRNQRRADALGAMAIGADRLGCRCGQRDCPPRRRPRRARW